MTLHIDLFISWSWIADINERPEKQVRRKRTVCFDPVFAKQLNGLASIPTEVMPRFMLSARVVPVPQRAFEYDLGLLCEHLQTDGWSANTSLSEKPNTKLYQQ